MKKRITYNLAMRTVLAILLIFSAVSMSSCTFHMCSAYAKPRDRVYFAETAKNKERGARGIPSPFNAEYKAKMNKRY